MSGDALILQPLAEARPRAACFDWSHVSGGAVVGIGVAVGLPMGLLVSFALLTLVFFVPLAHADGLLYVDHLAVYDATGRQVGSAWPVSDAVWLGERGYYLVVEFRLGTTPVVVPLRPHWTDPDGFETSWLRFPNPGCTGAPMVHAFPGLSPFTTLTPITAVAGPRSTVYVQSGPIVQRTVRSTLDGQGVCADHAPQTGRVAVLKATTTHLADYFVPPFTTRTRGRTPVPREVP